MNGMKVDVAGLAIWKLEELKTIWRETYLAAIKSGMSVYHATIKADEGVRRYHERFHQ